MFDSIYTWIEHLHYILFYVDSILVNPINYKLVFLILNMNYFSRSSIEMKLLFKLVSQNKYHDQLIHFE
jgi:hypothetical protein